MSCQLFNKRSGTPSRLLSHHVMVCRQLTCHNSSLELAYRVPDWTEINVVERITKVVARVSSCMFGGTHLSENAQWVDASIAFAVNGFHGAQKIKKFPHFLRPLAQYFIPEIRAIAAHYREAEKAAIPILKRRQETGEEALDLLYWMSDQAKGSEKDMKFIASILLKVNAILGSAVSPVMVLDWIGCLRLLITGNADRD